MKSMAHMAAFSTPVYVGALLGASCTLSSTKYIEDHVEIQITTIHFFF